MSNRRARFEGLGMCSAQSAVLGKDVSAGSIGTDKIDGATGMPTFATLIFIYQIEL